MVWSSAVRLLFFGIFLAALFAGYTLGFRPYENSEQFQFMKFQGEALRRDLKGEPVSTLILGSSLAVSGVLTGLFGRGLSLAMNAGSIMENYYSLKRFTEAAPAPACIVLVTNFNWKLHRERFFTTFIARGFYGPREISEVFGNIRRSGAEMPAPAGSTLSYWFNALFHFTRLPGMFRFIEWVRDPVGYGNIFIKQRYYKNLVEGNGTFTPPNYDLLFEVADTFDLESTVNAHLFAGFAPDALEDWYLNKLVELGSRGGSKVYVIVPPISPMAKPELHRYYGSAVDHLRGLLHEPDARLIDMTALIKSRDLYRNSTHLLVAGAHRFTREIISRTGCK